MDNNSKVLAIIPARAGSKGLPGKNSLILCGKPLIQWTIEAALDTSQINKIVVSSDDNHILRLAETLGATAHARPISLCDEFTPASEVISDVLRAFPNYETLIYLQPTSPLRNQQHIFEALDVFQKQRASAVVSVTKMSKPLEWVHTLDADGRLVPYLKSQEFRRQDTEIRYIPNGAIYIGDINSLEMNNYNFSNLDSFPYLMDATTSIDIDERFDFDLAEWIMKGFLKSQEDDS